MSMEENHQRIIEIASKYQVSAVNQVNEFSSLYLFEEKYECHVLSNYLLILVD